MMSQNQREVIRVDPDDAELWVVGVVSGHVLQDLQELITICGDIRRTSVRRQTTKAEES